jgi:hypothetical protein
MLGPEARMGSSLPFSTTRVYHDWFDITTSLVYITLKFPGGMCLGSHGESWMDDVLAPRASRLHLFSC